MKRSLAITAASVTMLASACITDQALWGSCNPAGDPWGTDGHWVLYCDKGEWVPTMTAQEFVDISSGKNVTIGTLPTKPAPTTTSTTSTSTSTTSTSTTTSTVPVPLPVYASGPLTGAPGDSITWTGTFDNLGDTPEVNFNAFPVEVTASSPTSITFTVPALGFTPPLEADPFVAGDYAVTVNTWGGTSVPQTFTVTAP
ncbi:MAG: IPT/TIG domain-containing protein [Microthrixaceae bacterium]|nr:hypothetical protein [Microthrixaceae bacterium]MCO5311314.1 IPT/TIG domain-containing protein [Microthrixaceae bacterium]